MFCSAVVPWSNGKHDNLWPHIGTPLTLLHVLKTPMLTMWSIPDLHLLPFGHCWGRSVHKRSDLQDSPIDVLLNGMLRKWRAGQHTSGARNHRVFALMSSMIWPKTAHCLELKPDQVLKVHQTILFQYCTVSGNVKIYEWVCSVCCFALASICCSTSVIPCLGLSDRWVSTFDNVLQQLRALPFLAWCDSSVEFVLKACLPVKSPNNSIQLVVGFAVTLALRSIRNLCTFCQGIAWWSFRE